MVKLCQYDEPSDDWPIILDLWGGDFNFAPFLFLERVCTRALYARCCVSLRYWTSMICNSMDERCVRSSGAVKDSFISSSSSSIISLIFYCFVSRVNLALVLILVSFLYIYII